MSGVSPRLHDRVCVLLFFLIVSSQFSMFLFEVEAALEFAFATKQLQVHISRYIKVFELSLARDDVSLAL